MLCGDRFLSSPNLRQGEGGGAARSPSSAWKKAAAATSAISFPSPALSARLRAGPRYDHAHPRQHRLPALLPLHPSRANPHPFSFSTPPVVPENQVQPVRSRLSPPAPPPSPSPTTPSTARLVSTTAPTATSSPVMAPGPPSSPPAKSSAKTPPLASSAPSLAPAKSPGSANSNTVQNASAIPAWAASSSSTQIDRLRRQLRLATTAQLLTFDPKIWGQRFYTTHGDKFDFLHFSSSSPARTATAASCVARNPVQWASALPPSITPRSSAAPAVSSATPFIPFPRYSMAATWLSNHETGHQWINFCSVPFFASGIPHWPRGNVAGHLTSWAFPSPAAAASAAPTASPSPQMVPAGRSRRVPGKPSTRAPSTPWSSTSWGLLPRRKLTLYFVLVDQNQNVTNGKSLQPAEMTTVTVNDVIAARGPRVPSSVTSQKHFRSATIVISEQLLDAYAIRLHHPICPPQRGQAAVDLRQRPPRHRHLQSMVSRHQWPLRHVHAAAR